MTRTYEVYDTKEDKHYTGLTQSEVCKKIRIKNTMVSKYALNHWHYKKRYYIIEDFADQKIMTFKPDTVAIMDEFNKAMKALKKNYTEEFLRSIKVTRQPTGERQVS